MVTGPETKVKTKDRSDWVLSRGEEAAVAIMRGGIRITRLAAAAVVLLTTASVLPALQMLPPSQEDDDDESGRTCSI